MASKHNLLFLLEIRDKKRLIHIYYNFSISPGHFDSFKKIDPDWFFCSVTQSGKISLKSVQFCIWNFICDPGFCARHTEWRYCSSYNFHENFENPLRDVSCEDYRPWISRSHPSSQPSLHTLQPDGNLFFDNRAKLYTRKSNLYKDISLSLMLFKNRIKCVFDFLFKQNEISHTITQRSQGSNRRWNSLSAAILNSSYFHEDRWHNNRRKRTVKCSLVTRAGPACF